jgi:DNA-binding NarL/FixJ family response regulator
MNGIRNAISSDLTAREAQIVELLVNGSSTKDIASRLHISMDTVKTHRKNIHKKLNTHSVVQLMIKMRDVELV